MDRFVVAYAGLVLLAGPASAQMGEKPAQTCTAMVAPPAELAGWTGRVAVTAAGKAEALGTAMLTPGKGADVALLPTPDITYPVRPGHPGGSVSNGGLLGFTITQAGTYRVAIGSGAWLEVVRGTETLVSTAHSPGPACTGVRKMVDFALMPGDYLLEIAGNGTPTLPVLVTRLP